MTSNNYERLKIVLDMVDPFDYDEFLRICETEKIQPLSINEYAMKVGYVMMAQVKYPDVPIEEAYMKIVVDANGQQAQGCSSCGDKKDKPLPSLGEQAANFLTDTGRHIANGLKEVTLEVLNHRNAICIACEYMREDGRCSKCGCPMKIKAKWEIAKCKESKW